MKNPAFAARSHIRSVVLCSLVTFGLAACASDAGSTGSAAASASPGSLVAPSVGVIDRSAGVTAGTTQGTVPASNSTIPASSSTTVKGPNPVATTPPVATVPPPKSPSTGTATLDWTPPTENSDGSSLTNLAGYTVYYGTSPDRLTESVKISNPGLTAYTVSNLTSGTWYFAVTSYSSTGVESSRSGVIGTKI